MAISYAEYEQVDCPNCGQTFEAKLWQIIDIGERLDLILQGFDRTLHRIVCENCKQEIGWANVALLLYGPTQPYPLVFSPAQNSSRDEDTREAGRLLGILAERAGQDWSDALLADGLPVVERNQAVSVMTGKSQPTVWMNISVQREQDLDDIALTFMFTGSWERARLFLDSPRSCSPKR